MATRFGTSYNLTAKEIDTILSLKDQTFINNANENLLSEEFKEAQILSDKVNFLPKNVTKKTTIYTQSISDNITKNYSGTWYKSGWFSQRRASETTPISFAYGNEIFYSKNDLPYTDEKSTGVYINANWSGLNTKFDSDNFVIGGYINSEIVLDTGNSEPFPYKNFYEIFDHSGIQIGDMGSNFIQSPPPPVSKVCYHPTLQSIMVCGTVGQNANISIALPTGNQTYYIEYRYGFESYQSVSVQNRGYYSSLDFINAGYQQHPAIWLSNAYNTYYSYASINNIKVGVYWIRARAFCNETNSFSRWTEARVDVRPGTFDCFKRKCKDEFNNIWLGYNALNPPILTINTSISTARNGIYSISILEFPCLGTIASVTTPPPPGGGGGGSPGGVGVQNVTTLIPGYDLKFYD